jgi:hypothetical protein
VIFGDMANDKVAALKDLNGREFLVLGVLAVAVLLVGLWPAPLLDVMRASTQHLSPADCWSRRSPLKVRVSMNSFQRRRFQRRPALRSTGDFLGSRPA